MKAIAHDTYGTPDVLELRDVDRPRPGDGEVLLRVTAASVNPLDWHLLTGTPYLVRPTSGLRRPKRQVAGADVAGVVEAVGPNVDGLALGDRVFGTARTGSFAEYAVASAAGVAATPETLTDAEAAAIPVAGVTALQGLRDHGRVAGGHRLLVNGAAGGVGTFAVQLGVAMGAEVTGVCSTDNVEMVRDLGAGRVIDYTTEELVDGTTYDVLLDNVGNRSITDCTRLLVDDGAYVMVSGPKDNALFGPVGRLLVAKVRFAFRTQRFANFIAAETAEELRELIRYHEAGQLRPVIDRRYPLVDAAEAIRYVATGHAKAKVVIDVAG